MSFGITVGGTQVQLEKRRLEHVRIWYEVKWNFLIYDKTAGKLNAHPSWSQINQEKPSVIDNIKRSLVNFILRLKDTVSNFYAPGKKAGSGLAYEEYAKHR